jgi:uncharacterized protein YraI
LVQGADARSGCRHASPLGQGALVREFALERRQTGLCSQLVRFALLGLLLLFRAPAIHADPAVALSGSVSSPDGLNLRGGPGTSFPVLTVMPGGARVSILGATTAGDWFAVRYGGTSGWALAAYVAAAQTPPPATVAVLANDLHIRGGPDASSDIVAAVSGGTELTVSGAGQGNWIPVSYNALSGWVNAAYVSLDGATPLITSSATDTSGGATLGVGANLPTPPMPPAAPPAGPTSAAPAAQVKLIWPVASRRISTLFSPAHLGIDIDEADEVDGPVVASAAGTVIFAGGDPCCSYGLYVEIDHGNGIATLYAHFSHIDVSKGQTVAQGQKIGNSGCTGLCTGPHVHYEVHVNDRPVDPLYFLPPPWKIE